ncbi:MAG: hypothetical protein RR280_08710 [Bacteroidaceae bacterium]
MRYALRKKDKIAQELSTPYLDDHILQSLKYYFENRTDEQIQDDLDETDRYSNVRYDVLRINDQADDNCMLEFAILDQEYDVMKLAFLGRVKG